MQPKKKLRNCVYRLRNLDLLEFRNTLTIEVVERSETHHFACVLKIVEKNCLSLQRSLLISFMSQTE